MGPNMPVAEVLLDNSLERPLDYSIPDDFDDLEIGTRVEVPLRGRSAVGTILALKKTSSFSKLKSLGKKLGDKPLVSPELFELAAWITKYYASPLSKVLKVILPPVVRNEKKGHKVQMFVKPLISRNALLEKCKEKRDKFPSQAVVLDALLEKPKGLFLTEILEKTSVTKSPISTLCKQGILKMEEVRVDRSPVYDHDFFPTKPKTLSKEQKEAYSKIVATAGTFQPHLLFGVTGSGKTEVYLQVIQDVLNRGEGVLYLVPEIALTSQTIERFKGRFGDQNIAVLHHRLSEGERFDAWHKIRSGEAKIVLGARSAIFSPVEKLGLIIVDEEHESAFKQSEEAPKYHARDVAVMRSKFSKCPIILGTATPSIESYHNALQGKYQLHLLQERADSASLPSVQIIDMKEEFAKAKGYTLFSDALLDKLGSRFKKGEQTLLFLNRRGYHTSCNCLKCGHVEKCPNCELTLTYHRSNALLSCHLCDHTRKTPKNCPSCQTDGPLKFKGAGTEMVERSLHALFPEIRSLRLDADTTKHKGSHEKIFKAFRSGKADVLIGTQMIAKGLHFPMVTLVGVLGLDGSLNIPDFRAGENVFQLLTQVAGRSGRGELAGEVVIQTHLPESSTILHGAAQDFEGFYKEEIEVRKLFHFPPFSQLIKFSFASENEKECERKAVEFRKKLIAKMSKETEILPVVPCGYAKIKGKHRFQCLLKTPVIRRVLPAIEQLRLEFGKAKGVRLSIDVNPLTTFF